MTARGEPKVSWNTRAYNALNSLKNRRGLAEEVVRSVFGEANKVPRKTYTLVWNALGRLCATGFVQKAGLVYTAVGDPGAQVDGRKTRPKRAHAMSFVRLSTSFV